MEMAIEELKRAQSTTELAAEMANLEHVCRNPLHHHHHPAPQQLERGGFFFSLVLLARVHLSHPLCFLFVSFKKRKYMK